MGHDAKYAKGRGWDAPEGNWRTNCFYVQWCWFPLLSCEAGILFHLFLFVFFWSMSGAAVELVPKDLVMSTVLQLNFHAIHNPQVSFPPSAQDRHEPLP